MPFSDAMHVTLTTKIGFLLVVLTTSAFLALGTFHRFLTVTGSAPDFINVAGRQRMISERLKGLSASIGGGHDGDRDALGESVKTFDQSLDVLAHGGEVDNRFVPPAPAEISQEMSASRRLWSEVKATLLFIAATRTTQVEAHQASVTLQPKLDQLVEASNGVVIAYLANLQVLRSEMYHTLFGVCAADSLTLLVGLLLIRRYISRPVRLIKEGALRVRAGDFGHPVPVVTKDELATLAETFNVMSAGQSQLLEAIRRSEERFRALVENSHEGVVLVSRERKFLYASRPMQSILGYAPDEFIGRSTSEFIHPEDREMARSCFENALANPGQLVHADLRLLHKNGSSRLLELRGINRIDDPAVGAVVTNCRDVSEHKQLEEELRQAQKMEAIGRLAGGVAHDFNNLLTAILGYSSLVLARMAGADPMRSQIEEIRAAAERAALLTRQLLAFSRRQVLQPIVLDLNAIVAGIENMLRRLIGEDIEIVLTLDSNCGNVKADRGQVEQIIMNLAVNARDAMPKGGRLTIQTARCGAPGFHCVEKAFSGAGPYVVLSVTDTGIGMDAATLTHIFEPFFTTKPSGEGTGLGLATVYGIVKQSGGDVTVKSELGKGTTFRICLPQAGETIAAAGSYCEPPVTGGSETILLVEDEEAVRLLVGELLRAHGYSVIYARNGAEALPLAQDRADPIHLMLTDLVMPVMGGQELAGRMSAIRPETKVLFMSGYPQLAMAGDGLAHVPFCHKPITPHALLRMVRDVLDGSYLDDAENAG